MLCAQRRGDAVPKLFRDLAKGKTVEDTKALFESFKLALNLTWAFSGLPQCIPACLGLVGELRELGISGPGQIDRYVWNSRRTAQSIWRSPRLTSVHQGPSYRPKLAPEGPGDQQSNLSCGGKC